MPFGDSIMLTCNINKLTNPLIIDVSIDFILQSGIKLLGNMEKTVNEFR